MKNIIQIISEHGSVLINCESIEMIKTHMVGHEDLEGKELCKIIIYLKNYDEEFSGYLPWEEHSDFQHFIRFCDQKTFVIFDRAKIVDHMNYLDSCKESN